MAIIEVTEIREDPVDICFTSVPCFWAKRITQNLRGLAKTKDSLNQTKKWANLCR